MKIQLELDASVEGIGDDSQDKGVTLSELQSFISTARSHGFEMEDVVLLTWAQISMQRDVD